MLIIQGEKFGKIHSKNRIALCLHLGLRKEKLNQTAMTGIIEALLINSKTNRHCERSEASQGSVL